MTENPSTRVSLILRLRQPEDAEAWQEFVEIYQPLIYRLATNKGLQPADARDVTQDVLMRVAKAVNQWNPDPDHGTFRGWVSRIARNLVIDFLRSKGRRPISGDNTSIFEILNNQVDDCAESGVFDIEYERQIFAWAAEKIEGSFSARAPAQHELCPPP